MDERVALSLPVLIIGIVGVLFAAWLARNVFSRDRGTSAMQDVGDRIYEGAIAYLRRQYGTIARLAIVVAIIIGLLVGFFEGSVTRGVITALSFLVGASLSALAGWIGMYVAVRSNVRTASAARRSLGEALTVALRGGAVSGFLVVSLGLLGVLIVYWVVSKFVPSTAALPAVAETAFWIVGLAFGASFVALFAQLGGGIYTKAADVGADLVGKVEAGIPEDDPRNPAVIADLVGDNVGDCAGRGADIFESSIAEMIGAMVLGAALFMAAGGNPNGPEVGFLFFPLLVPALGLVASLIGLLTIRPGDRIDDPMDELNKGFRVAAGLSAILMVVAAFVVLPYGKLQYAICGLVGIVTSLVFVYITQYYTSGRYRPVKSIMTASETGPATNIIAGIAVGFETTGLPAITIGAALLAAFFIGNSVVFPTPPAFAGSAGIFGTAIATMGMLMSAAYILAMDTFGPITDNAGGVVEMSNQPEAVRDVTDALDSAGNTTKALTKGYAVGTAALAAFLLFSAFLQEVERFGGAGIQADVVNLANPVVFVGGLLGAMLVYVFASLAIRAVGRAAGDMIEEVRRQFRADPGIMAGSSRPNYEKCVDISVRASLREMVLPGLLAVAVPILVGLILGWEAAAGMLMIGTISGVLLANVLNNGGGAWDNAKKMIEAGALKDAAGNILGKGSAPHAAAVVGDTVGDPWKDTAGPSLHVLIKLLATITLVLAPLFVR
ncbi:MAG TPA: sodium-translocating pyrophosphatase [Thermomicrobiales bacterium]|nr:sodium-translocating pyrophosphatase [Thermomicrobiales bacterium]